MISEKLKEHLYCIRGLIESGGFSNERVVRFPCYDDKNRLGIGSIVCHPDYVDEEHQLCRADVKRVQGYKATVYLNGETFKVHVDSLVKNN